MADIALDANEVRIVFDQNAEVYDFVSAVALEAGEVVYLTSAGLVNKADANDAAADQPVGIALQKCSAGEAVSVLKRGHLYGFTLSGLNPGDYAFLSDNPGNLADTASVTLTVPVGRVMVLSDKPNYTKVLYVNFTWHEEWA